MPKPMLTSVILFVTLCAQARAAEVVIPVQAKKTVVMWTLGAPLHTVHGEFGVKDGLLRFDPLTNSVNGTVTIDLVDGESGNAKRDGKMRDDVLETGKYPLAIFTARSVAGHLDANGTSQLMLTGTLLIHGSPHELTLPLELVSRDGEVRSGETRFSIPYVAWGMHDPSTFLLRVSDHVDVDVQMTPK